MNQYSSKKRNRISLSLAKDDSIEFYLLLGRVSRISKKLLKLNWCGRSCELLCVNELLITVVICAVSRMSLGKRDLGLDAEWESTWGSVKVIPGGLLCLLLVDGLGTVFASWLVPEVGLMCGSEDGW